MVTAALGVALASACALYSWLRPGRVDAEITAPVQRGDLALIVTERGDLESSKTTTVKCEVEVEQIKIVSIVPEGTHVKKDEIVVRFDADKLKTNLAEQEIKYKQAVGKAEQARQELEVQKNKGEGEVAKAELALTLAELDHEKYFAPQGDFTVEVNKKKGLINLAEKELQDAEEKLKHFESFVKEGFGTPEQLRLKQLEVDRTKNNLLSAKADLVVLEKFTRRRQDAELSAKAADAKREVARQQNSAAANVAKAKADLEAAEVVAALEKERLERVRKQLEYSVIKSPEDGIVSYVQTRFWDQNSRIQAGTLVSFQQPIFKIPDLRHMEVRVKIHEAKVNKLRAGQKAEIRVDAHASRVLHGTVKSVATLADFKPPWMGGAKEYDTVIEIDDLPADAALKPGMTAEVRIQLERLPDVLLVPVQAVAERAGQHFVYVSGAGGPERRAVEVGESNDKFVEIRDGLAEGETVCLDARARAAAEAKATGEEPPKEDKAKEERPPSPPAPK